MTTPDEIRLERAVDTAVRELFNAVARTDSVVNSVTGLGGSSDKGTTVSVDTSRAPMIQADLDVLGRFNGYVVEWFARLVEESVLAGWDVQIGQDRQEEFGDFDREMGIQATLLQALRGAVNDGAALILLVTNAGGRGRRASLRTPLRNVRSIDALHVFDQSEFTILEYEDDWTNPGWRRPRYFSLNPVEPGGRAAMTSAGQRVHASRCIYVPGRRLPTRLYLERAGKDDSYIESTWDAIKDMTQVDQGAAILAQEMQQTIIKIAGLEQVEAGALAAAFMERLRVMVAGRGLLNATVVGKDEDVITRAATTTGYKDLKAGSEDTWAAQTSQPQTIAYGVSPSGLNTDGEAGRRAWDRVLVRFQETHIRPILERIYSLAVDVLGITGRWRLVFREVGTLTPREKAELREIDARTDRINIQEGVYSAAHARASRYGEDGYGDIRVVPEDLAVPPTPETALDAASMTAVAEVVGQVAVEDLPRESGVAMLVHLLRMSEDAAEAIMGDVGRGFTREKEIPPAPGAPGGDGDDAPDGGDAP